MGLMSCNIFMRNSAYALFALALIAIVLACGFGAAANEGHAPHKSAQENTGLYVNTGDEDFVPPMPGSYKLPPIKSAGDGDVLTHDGREASLKKLLAGRISIISFIYTSCDDAKGCPLATAKLFDLHDMSMTEPEIAKHAQIVSLSFDPAHDTPSVMKNYGSAALTDDDRARKMPWHFLTTKSAKDIKPILAHYGQVIDKRGTGSAISHLLRVYLVDRSGQIRNIYGLGFLDQRLLIGDIKTLLLEEAALAGNAIQ